MDDAQSEGPHNAQSKGPDGVDVFRSASELSEAATTLFVSLAREATAARGRFAVALSGGATPLELFRRLAKPEFVSQTDWSRIHLFWGDERCVPPGHPDSNYGAARQTLIERIPIPDAQVHRMRGEWAPETAAVEYERELRAFFEEPAAAQPAWPRFDLVLLGMGSDGHTASLFPGAAVLRETSRWVAAYFVDAAHGWRITLTPPALNAGRLVAFLVAGADKAERLRQVLIGPAQPERLPAQIIRPVAGRLRWLLDAAAAAEL
jgi:6-phosphogluconolactonase